MAKRESRPSDQSQYRDAYEKAGKAMQAWHDERLEWADRSIRSLMLANGGGAIAVAAYVGTSEIIPGDLIASLLCFSSAIMVLLLNGIGRYLFAEFYTWYLKKGRRGDAVKLKVHYPPIRPQIYLSYSVGFAAFALFLAGILLAVGTL